MTLTRPITLSLGRARLSPSVRMTPLPWSRSPVLPTSSTAKKSSARAMAPEDKLLEGPRLFERACRVMCEGIRHQHPDLDEAGVEALLRARLDRVSSLESS